MSETKEQVKPTRYKTNERYKLTANLAAKRQDFQFALYREWWRMSLAMREEVERLLDSLSSKKNGVR